jgi:hypothetical protein
VTISRFLADATVGYLETKVKEGDLKTPSLNLLLYLTTRRWRRTPSKPQGVLGG